VINTNLPPVLRHFLYIAFDRSKNRNIWLPLLCLTPPDIYGNRPRGFPWDDLRKIFCGQRMANVGAVEILPKISTASVGRTSVTDRRQTDGRQQIANVNVSSSSLMKYHISYFYNSFLEYYPLHQAWCET